MKKGTIPAIAQLVLSAAAAVGVMTFLAPCVHEDGSFGTCHWAGMAAFGVASLAALLALCALLIPRKGVRPGLFIASAAACVLGLLTPGTLIPLCKMTSMRCRELTQPALMILFGAALIAAVIGCARTWREA